VDANHLFLIADVLSAVVWAIVVGLILAAMMGLVAGVSFRAAVAPPSDGLPVPS
jgi:tetrahydromethanopterin S-methyltransferase subunit B